MSVKLIQNRLNAYNCKSEIEEEQALREITQEVSLAALGRTDFFNEAEFHGGTSLRIFYGLNRFSEDLDFALKNPDVKFSLKPFLDTMQEELSAYGYHIEIQDRSSDKSFIKKAFLKDDSMGKIIRLQYSGLKGPLRKIQIKFEVDTNPPAGALSETKYIDFPFLSAVSVHNLPTLFAGKIHALLCREYIKGRDWYDFIWYTSNKITVNLNLLSNALFQMGPWKNIQQKVTNQWVKEQLAVKINGMDWGKVAKDVVRFLRPNEHKSLSLWCKDFFLQQLDKM